MARIVHEADLEDERYHEPAARGLDLLIRGLSMVNDDERPLQITDALFTGSSSTVGAQRCSGRRRR